MDNLNKIPITIFTGAGASSAKNIELPTMKEFFKQIMAEESHDIINDRITGKKLKDFFKYVMDTLYGPRNLDNDYDLERVMGALYDMNNFMQNDCWKIFMNPNIASILKNSLGTIYKKSTSAFNSTPIQFDPTNLLQETLENEFNKNKELAGQLILDLEDIIRDKYDSASEEGIRSVYEPFFELIRTKYKDKNETNPGLLPFFTTNYDMCIDWFFDPQDPNFSIISDTWLSKDSVSFKLFDGFMGGSKWIENKYSNIEAEGENIINIVYHKLHGSLYWERVKGIITKGSNSTRDQKAKPDLVLIYPSDKKILTDEPFAYNHRMLDRYLSRTDKFLIIGFSFRDPMIVQAFDYALKFNPELKAYIINPPVEKGTYKEMDRFLKDWQGRVEHIETYFGSDECINKLDEIL